MNHREPPQVPQGMLRGRQFLLLLLVAAVQEMGLLSAHAGTLFSAPRGYLTSRGAPPLRFAEVTLPDRPVAQLASVGAPKAGTSQAAVTNHPSDQPASADVSLRPPSSTGTTVIVASPDKAGPLPILPDEVRPQIRPEDVLPYFQIPGSGRNPAMTVLVPAPLGQPSQPPPQTSSATYLQPDQ